MSANVFSVQIPVSRKTPADGKLEIPADVAARLEPLGAEFALVALGTEGRARLEAFECTCGKGAGERHVHHFVVSTLLRGLTPGAEVRVDIDLARAVVAIQ